VTLASWPQFEADQIDAATRVLASGQVNAWTGEETKAFELEFAAWCGSKHAIAIANGSLALSAVYLALGLGSGDELITTPRTFIATASSAVLLGARPVFADVDPDSGAITAATIARLITPRTKAIAVVHLGGWPADMPAICDLARAHSIAVLEDCAQAHGARIHGQSVGSFGDVAAWSFCQDKILTTAGEGGMVTTSRPELWDAMWAFKDHGKTQEAVFGREHPPGFRWLHEKTASAPTSASPSCRAPLAASSSSACASGLLFALAMLFCSLKHWVMCPLCACPCRPRGLSMPGISSTPSCSQRPWPMAGAAIVSFRKSLLSAIPPSPAAAARSTWKSVSRMQASPQPNAYPLPVCWATRV